jgi:MGT family glycosyltransferase
MSHFGVLSYKGTGHLNPLIALSRQLVARGHRVTFFQKPELEARVRLNGLEFSAIGKARSFRGPGRTDDQHRPSSGIAALRYGIRRIIENVELSLRETPSALTQAGINALIVDEIVLSGPTLAQMLHLPYFVVSTSIPHNFGWTVPSWSIECNDPISHFDRLQNAMLQTSVFRMRGPIRWKLDEHRRQAGLGPSRKVQDVFPALAQIAQLPRCLDFPHTTLPSNFHYTGPFIDESARPFVDFPWNRLDGRPLVYASLGTARKDQPLVFHLISEACNKLNLQVVMSLGGRGDPEKYDDLPGNPVVVKDAPQLELIKMAALVITHGGLNTVLETLLEGKPMIAIPFAYDQPAVAARLAWLRAAEVIPMHKISVKSACLALSKVITNPLYRDAARELQASIRSAHGLDCAVKVIERSLEAYAASCAAGDTCGDRRKTIR